MPPTVYLLVSAFSTLVFWGLTCTVAFDSPLEQFLKRVARARETLEASQETLSQVVDTVHNVRTEVEDVQPLSMTVENIEAEMGKLKKEFRRIEEKGKLQPLCATCGKPVSLEFRLCPFCGDPIKLTSDIAVAKAYR